MFQWLQELYEIRRQNRVCESCEVLKTEISNMRRERDRLLEHVLTPAPVIPERTEAPVPQAITNRHVPWRVVQQQLEREDKAKAEQIRKEFADRVQSAEAVMGVDSGKEKAGV